MQHILQAKCQLRDQLKLLRSQSDLFHLQHISCLIKNITKFIHGFCDKQNIIACFWPLEGEADLCPLIYQLYEEGYKIALPKTPIKGKPLVFYQWYPTAVMKEGRYKTLYPDTDIVIPDFILVPLMAFDRYGNRLGYGGGYYDRTLQKFSNVQSAGIAFSYQEVSEIPTEEFDFVLPVIITESEIIYT